MASCEGRARGHNGHAVNEFFPLYVNFFNTYRSTMCRTRPERVLQHESRQPSFVHGCGDGPAWGALGLRDEARAPAGLQNRRVKGCLWCTKGADLGQGHAAASAGHSGAKTQEGACFYGGGCLGRKTRRAQKHTGNWSEMAPLGAPGPIFRVKTGSKVHGVKPTILVRFRKKNCVRVRKVWGPHMGTVGPRNSDLQKSAPGGRLASALGARRTCCRVPLTELTALVSFARAYVAKWAKSRTL